MSIVTLSKETFETLQKMFDVDQSLKLVAGEQVLKSKSGDNTMLIHAPIDVEFPRDFHIYDLREFLNVIKIIPDAQLDFSNDKYVLIRSVDGSQKLRYMESDPEFVKSYTPNEPNMASPDLEVEVTEEDWLRVLKAAQIMKLQFVGFVSTGEGKVTLSAFNQNNGDENMTNVFSVEVQPANEVTESFQMFYKLETQNIGVLSSEGKLSFEITKNRVSRVKTESGKTLWVSMNVNSKWGS